MALPWFRMYAEAAGDPVLQSLAFDDQRHYFVLLCLKCGGALDRRLVPQQRERIIARGLGLDQVTASEVKRRLLEVSLIDKNWQPLGWEKRQFSSDVSTDRVRKYRKDKETGNVSETGEETSSDVSETSVTISESVSDSDIKTSRLMFDLIRTLNPKHREPNLQSWANDVRLMRERDGRTDAEIRVLFEWSNQHHFWKTNILSPATLRKQWDKLVIQRDNAGGSNAPRQPVDNSAVGKVRQANAAREQRAADAQRQADGSGVGANGQNVRPPLDQ